MKGPEGRREAAARLREYGRDALKDGSLLKTLKDVTGGDSWRHVLLLLADLIDPADDGTSFALNERSKDGEEVYPTRWWRCARCGEETIMLYDEGEPIACPYCGARVVRPDGD